MSPFVKVKGLIPRMKLIAKYMLTEEFKEICFSVIQSQRVVVQSSQVWQLGWTASVTSAYNFIFCVQVTVNKKRKP